MSWNITLEIKDGKIRQDTDDDSGVEIIGTPPDGVIQVNGHTDAAGTTVALFARNVSVSARMPATSPAAGSAAEASGDDAANT